jgi:putative heme iron utilization protein
MPSSGSSSLVNDMPSSVHIEATRLLLEQRWAALATLHEGAPHASMVAYAAEPGLDGLLVFLSGLSAHTHDLLADPRASLVVSAPDSGSGDPQLLPRIGVQGRAIPIDRRSEAFPPAGDRYVARFPEARPRFSLADFVLFRFVPEEARYVGGFARATSLTGADLRASARALEQG